LNVSLDYLLGGGSAITRAIRSLVQDVDETDFDMVPRFDLRELGDEGKGAPLERIPLRKDWLHRMLGTSSELWLTTLLSDYPPKGLEEGDLVFCREIEAQELTEGNICLFRINGGIVIARYSFLRPVEFAQGIPVHDNYVVTPTQIGALDDMYVPIARILGKWVQRI